MIIHRADSDKPHRCPECWTIPDIIWEKHERAKWWAIYTCRNGHKFTRLLGRDGHWKYKWWKFKRWLRDRK